MVVTVLIPTNRYLCLRELLEKSIAKYQGEFFRFEIHDSSADDKIETLIESHCGAKRDLIRYQRYPSTISVDEKAMLAIQNVTTQFFWLMGDGNLVDFGKMELLLREEIGKYTVIDIESVNRIGHMGQDRWCESEKIYSYTDVNVYAAKYFSHLTYWGAQIVKTRYYRQCYENGILDKYRKHGIPWWIACTLFDLLACSVGSGEKVLLGVVYTNSMRSNPQKEDHWWTGTECYYDYTFSKFNRGVALLSDHYSQTTKEKIIWTFRTDALVSHYYLIHLRAVDNLKTEMLQKYKKEIAILPGFYRRIYLYHLMPRGIAQFLDGIKNRIKPVYFWMKRRIHK